MNIILEDKVNQICIKNDLSIFKLHANLLSMSKLMSNGLRIQFNLDKCMSNLMMVKQLQLRHANKTCTISNL